MEVKWQTGIVVTPCVIEGYEFRERHAQYKLREVIYDKDKQKDGGDLAVDAGIDLRPGRLLVSA